MIDIDRVALHRKLGEGMIDGLVNCVERQRVELPAEFVISGDAVVWAPMMYGTQEHLYSEELGAAGRTPSQRTTAEFRSYWTHMPDFRLVAHGQPVISDVGFSVWFRFEGTTSDGRTLGFYEADFIQTNEHGEISRIETFHDVKGLSSVLELLGVGSEAGWETMRKLRD